MGESQKHVLNESQAQRKMNLILINKNAEWLPGDGLVVWKVGEFCMWELFEIMEMFYILIMGITWVYTIVKSHS